MTPLRSRFLRLLPQADKFVLVAICFASIASGEPNATRQDGHDPDDQEFRAEAPERPRDMPLAELPEAPSLEYPAPRPEAVEAIDRLLLQITSSDAIKREEASRMLLEAKADWVGSLAQRISRLRERSDPNKQKELLATLREKRKNGVSRDSGDGPDQNDSLIMALEHSEPDSDTWRDLTQLLAMSRMLAAIATTESTREIIRIYQRFGEYMRIDCQKQLESMGELSTAGLIEAQRSQATTVSDWAKRLLRLSGRAKAQNVVHTKDDRALGEILVALGRNRDPDASPLLISFANAERAQVRRAARQGINLMGEVAAWQLKDAYLNTTGKLPPRDWTWQRTARELFTEFDRLRLAEAYQYFEEAETARKAGDLEKMRAGYDHVLALNPSFDKKTNMAEGYIHYAESIRETKRPQAILALRRAERVAPNEAVMNAARGTRQLIEAELLRERGIVDRVLIESSARLNPEENTHAQSLMAPTSSEKTWGRSSRYLIAGVTSLLAILGAAWVLFTAYRRRSIPRSSDDPTSRSPTHGESFSETNKKDAP